MNQILMTKLVKNKKKINQFIVQLSISIIAILVFISIYLAYNFQLQKEKIFSESVSKNYQVYKLFSNSDSSNVQYKDDYILGNISIPKININYPFFYGISEDLLKIAPCRFAGNMPDKKSNLCIAGHNYNDDRFFSKIINLNLHDLIIIEDNNKNKFYYYINSKYEIPEDKLSSVINTERK